MSDSPTPPVAESAAGARPHALTPDAVAAALADFRDWLTALAEAPPAPAPELSGDAPDLYTLLAQLTALRHEVNLQTRATRAQQEQNAETLRQLTQTLDSLRFAQSHPQDGEERLRPLLKALVDLHDALALAGREMGRIQENVLPALRQIADEPEPGDEPPLDFEIPFKQAAPVSPWSRWLGRPAPPEVDVAGLKARLAERLRREREKRSESARRAREDVERVRQFLGSLVAGYTMSLQRVERALRQQGLEPMAAAGQSFDPEKMEVVEAVGGSGRPAGEVLEEVRRGYLWNGRVFRFAQVRVARS